MPGQQISNSKVFGLEFQSNSYTARPGSLEKASNVVLSQDNILKSRRGFQLFYQPVRNVRKLSQYLNFLIGICADKVQVYTQNGDGTLASVSELGGQTVAISASGKSHTAESNGNFYFTTDNGVLKLESLTGNVLPAGIKRALDLTIVNQQFNGAETYLRPDSQIGYRVLFGRTDANNNKVIGAPSQTLSVSNTVSSNSGSVSNSGATITFTTASAHGLSPLDTIYIENADGGGLPDGIYVCQTGTTGTTINVLKIGAYSTITTLQWGKYYYNKIEYTIPSGLNSEHVVQIYRTVSSATSSVPPDISTLQLIDEFNLDPADVAVGFGTYLDLIPDILRGTFLYTNPNTGEAGGEAAANDEPPLAKDIALFKNQMFYGNVTQKYNLDLSLITSNTTTMPDLSEFKITGASARNYIGYAIPKVGNRTVLATSTSVSTLAVTVTYNGHGFSNGDSVTVIEALDSSGVQIANLPVGNYTVSSAAANTFVITAPVSSPSTLSTLYFAGAQTAAGKRLFSIDNTDSAAISIDTTAQSISKAINRDMSSPADSLYVSGINDIPGKIVLRSRTYTQNFYVNSVTTAINDSFTPSLATTGQTVIGTRTSGAGRVFVSKPSEPEAVPLANTFVVGAENNDLIRIKPLRDSIIVPKSDGIFRINGTDVTNFSTTILDGTVICKSAESVSSLNNTVYLFSTQGAVSIDETSVGIVSRQIEPVLTAVIGSTAFEGNTNAVGYESERLYLCTTQSPNSTTPDVVYCYNYLTQGWTTWDTYFTNGYVKPYDNKLYYVALNGTIYIERKNNDRLDYSDNSYSATILTVPSVTTATISVVGATPEIGDVFVKNSIIHRITAINGTLVTFATAHGLSASDAGLLYKGILCSMITSPLTAGDASIWKQFSEFQVHFRNLQAMSRLTLSFMTDSTSGSPETIWTNTFGSGGWGISPWGDFPWGLEEGLNLQFDTSPAQICRTYIPLSASRATYIKAILMHNSAAENMLIQEISYTTRGYGQRVTR